MSNVIKLCRKFFERLERSFSLLCWYFIGSFALSLNKTQESLSKHEILAQNAACQ